MVGPWRRPEVPTRRIAGAEGARREKRQAGRWGAGRLTGSRGGSMSLRRKYRFEHVRQEPCRGGGRALVPRLLICRKGAARRPAERPACQVDERDTIFRIATGEANSGTRTDAEVGAPANYPLAAARQHGRPGKAASVEKSDVEKEEPFGEVFEELPGGMGCRAAAGWQMDGTLLLAARHVPRRRQGAPGSGVERQVAPSARSVRHRSRHHRRNQGSRAARGKVGPTPGVTPLKKKLCGILAISQNCLYNLVFRRSALR